MSVCLYNWQHSSFVVGTVEVRRLQDCMHAMKKGVKLRHLYLEPIAECSQDRVGTVDGATVHHWFFSTHYNSRTVGD